MGLCKSWTSYPGQYSDLSEGATEARGKVLIFKQKTPSFHTTEFSYINFFLIEKRPNFGFLGGPESLIKIKCLFSWI